MSARVIVGCVVVALLGLPTAARADDPGPGCDPSRRAVAHHAGGAVLDPQPDGAPTPCMTITGPAIEAATIGVTSSGTAFFASIEQFPGGRRTIVNPSVVARSSDLGATWEHVVPGPVPLSQHGSLSTWLSVDPVTSRVWYATPAAPCGATVSWSDDDGDTWSQHPNVGCLGQGAAVLMEGPPPVGAEPTSGYPHVVYYCANAADGSGSVLFCHKTRDGGTTWRWVGGTPDPVPAAEGCGTTDLRRTRGGAVGRDGVLYLPTYSCGENVLGLALSRDEGATWTRSDVIATEITDLYPPALAIDDANTIYIAWRGAGDLPYLVRSTDGGATWSEPMMVGAPGVSAYRRLGIVARSAGHVLVSYIGDGHGWITESRNSLDADPVFWSGTVNDPSTPLYSTGSETFGDRMWFLRGHIADDGTPWAAFHCYNTAPLCPDSQRLGLAGRLAR